MTRTARLDLIRQLEARISRLYRLVANGLITRLECNEAADAIARRIGNLKQANYKGGLI